MKKIKKIKIKINGKIKSINQDSTLYVVLKNLKIPLNKVAIELNEEICLLYTSPSPRDRTRSRMPSSA